MSLVIGGLTTPFLVAGGLGGYSTPTPTPTPTPTVTCFVNPRLATWVLAPGNTPSSILFAPSIVQGLGEDYCVQVWNRGGLTRPDNFGVGDTLTGTIWQWRNPTPICTLGVDWYTAPDNSGNPTQTGYDVAQIVISASNADAALLQPTGGPLAYRIVVTWSPAAAPSTSFPIVDAPLTVTRSY